MKIVRRVITGETVYCQTPDFEDGCGKKNAVALFGGALADYEEVTVASVPKTVLGIRRAINDHCAAKFSAGIIYGGTTFQACSESQRRIAARATRALANKIDSVAFPWVSPHSDGWWDINNVVLASTTTVDGFLAFAKVISDYCSACDKCKRDHKDAVTTENCATYDYTTGWPVNP